MKHKQEFEVGKTLKTYRPPPSRAQTEPPTEEPIGQSSKHFSLKRASAIFLLFILAAFIFIGIWDALNINRALDTTFGTGNVFSLLAPTSLKSQDDRTNILLVGYSADDPGHAGATLTDSILLLSLNDHTHKGYMLSIPRDLYVSIPGYGYGKINEAYRDGGMGLLGQIITNDFGAPINYTALFNYASVKGIVNAVGGINIDIKSSDPRGIYDPSLDYQSASCCALANYPNGAVKLNGQQALDLTRARGDGPGSYGFGLADFDRTEHQRQIVLAIKQKLDWRLLLNPIENKRVFRAIDQNVKTNINVDELRPLFSLINSANTQNIKSYSLRDLNGANYLTSYSSYSAGSALVPSAGINDYARIQTAIAAINTQN